MTSFDGARARIAASTGLAGSGVTGAEVTAAIDDALTALAIPENVTDLADVSGTFASGDLFQYDGSGFVPYTPEAITVVGSGGFVIDGGGSVVTTGIKGDLQPFGFSGTITGVCLLADAIGNLSVQGWMDSIGNYAPTVADLLFTLTLSAAIRTPTGSDPYTTVSYPFTASSILRFNVTGTPATITRATVGLRIEREVGP